MNLNREEDWQVVRCPRCESDTIEEDPDSVTIFPDRDEYDSPIGTRGGYVNVDLRCSGCSCAFTFTVGNHKGRQVFACSRELDERERLSHLCESPIERAFWDEYVKRGLTALSGLRPQVVVGAYRVDFGIPERRLAIELDGFEFHSSREQMAKDKKRQRDIESEGWRVCRFSGREVHHDPRACLYEAATWADAQNSQPPT